jgi:hypothetical protein
MHDFTIESFFPYPKEEVMRCLEHDDPSYDVITRLPLKGLRHVKTVETVGGGCVVRDRLEYTSTWPFFREMIEKDLLENFCLPQPAEEPPCHLSQV